MLKVRVEFQGDPFSRRGVLHALRHVAMRLGWTLARDGERRIVFATVPSDAVVSRPEGALIIVSSPEVARFLRGEAAPIPLGDSEPRFPFPHPMQGGLSVADGIVGGDICAGMLWVQNLWYEWRSRPMGEDGWIRFADDWWPKAGFHAPEPLVDRWVDAVGGAARSLGWPVAEPAAPAVLLTHDVDYLPTRFNRGLPRVLRAVARQIILRKRPLDALRVAGAYLAALPVRNPYNDLVRIAKLEAQYGARSASQFVAGGEHVSDPAYDVDAPLVRTGMRQMMEAGGEVCLHGSYLASRTPGALAEEKAALERACGAEVLGHRQHYLNFHPATLFREVGRAGFAYDMSVGFNDIVGPRAGTLHPYRPYDLERDEPFSFWEIPFTLMDTTLASFMRLSAQEAQVQAMGEFDRIAQSGGTVSMIWHQEQCGGLLDPGFGRLYEKILEHLDRSGVSMPAGSDLLARLNASWAS